jgi:hypothetical protein
LDSRGDLLLVAGYFAGFLYCVAGAREVVGLWGVLGFVLGFFFLGEVFCVCRGLVLLVVVY